MEPTNPKLPNPHDVIEAAGEMMEVLCKMRGIEVDDLSEEEVDAIMVMAMEDNFPPDTPLRDVFGPGPKRD
ncbi:hypothetical protein [Caballeronia sp. LjRoot31]|jgi:hypothetical protein|uniref:hypothetical protein n=1 Tax=Caballeronia sp. LjRoot31 TaxID=3342324 RepID=UPI003ED05FFD